MDRRARSDVRQGKKVPTPDVPVRTMTGQNRNTDPVDEDLAQEQESSTVRPRLGWDGAAEGRDLQALLRVGEVLLADLSPGHPRARLLRVALMRRDETLLLALIEELGVSSSLRPTLLPPPRSPKR